MIPIRRKSGHSTGRLLLALGLGLLLGGCNYGFEGGGFPAHIQTIYIAPFENQTAQFDIEQELFTALLDELPARLGLRTVGRENADAVLTGQIRRYSDQAENYRAGSNQSQANILTHEVQIGVSAQLIDVRDNVIRWEANSVVGRGQYRPDTQNDDVGQQEAIENIIEQIIDGAQSQW